MQCTTGAVNLEHHVGKHVRVSGETRFDINLGLHIVEVGHLRVLDANARLPRPPNSARGAEDAEADARKPVANAGSRTTTQPAPTGDQ